MDKRRLQGKERGYREMIMPGQEFETPPPAEIPLIFIGGKLGSGVRTTATAVSDRLTRRGIPNERVTDDPFCAPIGPWPFCSCLLFTFPSP